MGTIGAKTNNAIGVAGINWQSKILPVRVLGKGGGYTSDIADGILWAAGLSVSGAPSNSNPAKVINLSLGGEGSCSSYMQNAINSAVSAGSVIVVAAGNEDIDVSNVTPANCQNVIAVASIDKDGNKASYSNYGSKITISAPGADCPSSGCPQSGYDDYYIWSTYNDGKTSPTTDSYIGMQGTSMATPHISGLISLMFSIKPNLTPEEVLYNLTKSTRSFPSDSSCNTSICGSGMADAYLSLLNLETKINSINPSSAVVNSNVYMDIYGSGFMKNAQIKLKKSGYTDITADNVNVLNLNHIN
jgi:serine protease